MLNKPGFDRHLTMVHSVRKDGFHWVLLVILPSLAVHWAFIGPGPTAVQFKVSSSSSSVDGFWSVLHIVGCSTGVKIVVTVVSIPSCTYCTCVYLGSLDVLCFLLFETWFHDLTKVVPTTVNE